MVEAQAIGRVARLGQRRPVTVYRYIMADTIEEVSIGNPLQYSPNDIGANLVKEYPHSTTKKTNIGGGYYRYA